MVVEFSFAIINKGATGAGLGLSDYEQVEVGLGMKAISVAIQVGAVGKAPSACRTGKRLSLGKISGASQGDPSDLGRP